MVACTNSACSFGDPPEGAKFCPGCGRPLSLITAEGDESQRRTVTIVYCDIQNSTTLSGRLDLEVLGNRLERFAQTAREVFTRHGGRAGTRQGDSMMGVFGIEVVSDDHALRAVRAAAELRDALMPLADELATEFGLEFAVRIGVNTGQVLVRPGKEAVEEQVEGQEVALAKRLEEHARPGQILVGEETYELVRDAIHTTEQVTLKLNGFREPKKAWRLGEVYRGRPGRIPHLTVPLVGRQHELTLLKDLFQWLEAEKSRQLVTLLGEAGVGKTRLAEEFVRGLGDQVTALRGHCLSYGEGVTFWPIKEIVRKAVGIKEAETTAAGSEQQLAKLSKGLSELLGGDDRDREALTTVKQVLGIGGEEAPSPADTPVALARLLENLARRKPLVLLIDDLHLADAALLDVLEKIAVAAPEREAPIMLLCMARPDELFVKREAWPKGRMNSFSLSLPPLKQEEGEQLIGHLLPAMQLRNEELAHLTRLAQGNPLIVEELVAMFVGKGWLRLDEGGWIATPDVYRYVAPPSVNVILQARLDKLDDEERKVIERAAVVGEQFHAIDVEALSPTLDSTTVAGRLDALVRHQIIQEDQAVATTPTAVGSEGYRFRHILMRQAAYDLMTLPVRAELHERYADWLAVAAGERVSELDELIASHLYEAYKYLRRQGTPDERVTALGQRAGEYFATAGRRAALRGDNQITETLLGRTDRLLPPGHPTRLEVLPDLADALLARGELERAMSTWEEIKQASTSGDDRASVNATLGQLYARAFCDIESFMRGGPDEVEALLPQLEQKGDCEGADEDKDGAGGRREDCRALAKATYLLAYLDYAMGRNDAAKLKLQRARELAKQADAAVLEASIVRLQCVILYWGPTPIAEVERYNEEALELARRTGLGNLEAGALTIAARIEAMRGEFEKARRLSKQAERINTEFGELLTQAMDTITDGVIGLLSNDLSSAEQALQRGFDVLGTMGGVGPRANVAAWLARVLLRQGRLDEAERMTRQCEECAATKQADAQAKWRSIRSVVLARRGQREEAETLIKEALDLADATDQPDTRAEVHIDHAEVLRLSGRKPEAIRELKRAEDLYEQKGNLAAIKRVSSLLVALR